MIKYICDKCLEEIEKIEYMVSNEEEGKHFHYNCFLSRTPEDIVKEIEEHLNIKR